VDQTFATQPNTPATGLSLYRFSAGHGGLQCSACHGSTHAEFPSTHANDNLRNKALQGHGGMMVECTACHTTMPVNNTTAVGGPHGMHPIGSSWISGHHDYMPGGATQCRTCHGTDYRGTVLSRAQTTRSYTVNFDTGTVQVNLFRGAQVGCYTCHNGPSSESANTSAAPTVTNVSTNTTNDQSVSITLPATGSGLTLRIISQPANGSVGLSNNVATYFPEPGFIGTETFTFAAYDGAKNSNLGTGTVTVAQGPFAIATTALVPPSYPAAWPVAFSVVPSVTNHTVSVSYRWNFGDASAPSTNQFAQHAYDSAGMYSWKVVSTLSSVSVTNQGIILIENPITLGMKPQGNSMMLSWPASVADSILESTEALASDSHWIWVTNNVSTEPGRLSVTVPAIGNKFFRVRRPW